MRPAQAAIPSLVAGPVEQSKGREKPERRKPERADALTVLGELALTASGRAAPRPRATSASDQLTAG